MVGYVSMKINKRDASKNALGQCASVQFKRID